MLEDLRQPGETVTACLRRLIHEAVERQPVKDALRAIEARLGRIEAPGSDRAQPPPNHDQLAVRTPCNTSWRHGGPLMGDDEPQG